MQGRGLEVPPARTQNVVTPLWWSAHARAIVAGILDGYAGEAVHALRLRRELREAWRTHSPTKWGRPLPCTMSGVHARRIWYRAVRAALSCSGIRGIIDTRQLPLPFPPRMDEGPEAE